MKKRYRDKALKALFARMESEDFDSRELALFQLGQMLRRANDDGSGRAGFEYDSDSLPRELQRIRLSLDDQRSIAKQLAMLISGQPESRATAIWTLSEMAGAAGWAPTMAQVKACGKELDIEGAYQLCRAMRRWLAALEPAQVKPAADSSGILALVAGWAESADDRLAREASAVVQLLEAKTK